jgi:hypothetical protein
MPERPRSDAHPDRIDSVSLTLYRAGVSDKYGIVYVEREGNNPFDDRDEPVALLRARDDLAMQAMLHYQTLNQTTVNVVERQVASVKRQVKRFADWRYFNKSKTRLPGVTDG